MIWEEMEAIKKCMLIFLNIWAKYANKLYAYKKKSVCEKFVYKHSEIIEYVKN